METYTELEREGLIQRFEYTFELARNTIKDFLQEQGFTDITGSRDAVRKAFQVGLLVDGEGWMKMIDDRIMTSHTYNEDTAEEIAGAVKEKYFNMFEELINNFKSKLNK
jgi:nucleotidyltransferase substrate binding protein (TIGR01987 family)